MINEEKMAALESYLRGQMTPGEADRFLILLQNDPALKAELDLHREVEEALGPSPLNTLRAKAAAILRENRAASLRRRRISLGLLAVLAVLALLATWLVMRSTGRPAREQLFAEYFQPPAELNQTGHRRTGEIERLQNDRRIDSLYRVKNFASALILLEAEGQKSDFQPSSTHFYQLGVLYLADRDAGAALRNLDRIELGYAYEKQWYRALAFLLLETADAEAEAKTELHAIAHSDSPFKKDASALLKRLSSSF